MDPYALRPRLRGHPPALLLCVLLALAGCSWLEVERAHPQPAPSSAWQVVTGPDAAASDVWRDVLGDSPVVDLARRAELGNYTLAEQRALLEVARAEARVVGADRWPAVTFDVGTTERRAGVDFARSSSTAEAGLRATWEIDLWGRLSDAQRGALLEWQAQEASYAGMRLDTIAAVARTWLDLVEAAQLVELLDDRLRNLEQNLAVIEDGYRLGLNQSLDVYLARNEVEQEAARRDAQRQARDTARRQLELALGDYPAGAIDSAGKLPLVETTLAAGVPSDVLSRHPDVRAAWLSLLSADAAVAVARKERFPHLDLTADVGRSALKLIKLVSESNLVWSLAAGITQPVFDAGRLAAREDQARARVVALEQQYLRTVFTAFTEVEEALSLERSLRARYEAFQRARTNARAAQELAFDQYRRGLVNYATVLEAQRRAFDAETQVIELRGDRVRNLVNLHQALGGAPPGA